MNTGNFEILIENFIERFYEMHNTESKKEYYKWEAVKSFKDKWDINASDFASMFKEAVKDTYNLIDNKFVQPSCGIVKLAERPELTETIRQLFVYLYSDDGGDIDFRQERISNFMGRINELLEKYETGKWRYVQNISAVIAYLNLRYPSQNYFFKSTQAHKFKECVEFSNDFGYGSDFKLKRYYQMCDEIKEKVKENNELKNLLLNDMNDAMESDDDYHIYVSDIIFCAGAYDLYWNIEMTKPKRKNTVEGIKIKKVNFYNEELDFCYRELDNLLNERSSLEDLILIGLKVSHKKFGKGTVTVHDGYKLTVEFGSKEMQFGLPVCFSNNILTTDSKEITDAFFRMKTINENIDTLRSQIVGVKNNIKKFS